MNEWSIKKDYTVWLLLENDERLNLSHVESIVICEKHAGHIVQAISCSGLKYSICTCKSHEEAKKHIEKLFNEIQKI